MDDEMPDRLVRRPGTRRSLRLDGRVSASPRSAGRAWSRSRASVRSPGGLHPCAASGRCGRSSSGSSRGCDDPKPSRHRCRHPSASARAFRSGCRRHPRCRPGRSSFDLARRDGAVGFRQTLDLDERADRDRAALGVDLGRGRDVHGDAADDPVADEPRGRGEALDRAVELGLAEAVVLGGLGDVDLGGRDRPIGSRRALDLDRGSDGDGAVAVVDLVAAETCTVVPETIQSPIGAVLGRLSMTPWNWLSSEPPPPLLACAAAVGTSAIIRVTAMPANVMRRSNPLTSMVVW